jgi:hypothetical protein
MSHIATKIINAAGRLSRSGALSILDCNRSRPLVHWRQAAMYVAKQTGMSFPDIASRFYKDHTTVMYSCKRVAACEYRLALAWRIAIAVKAARSEGPLGFRPCPGVLGAEPVCLGSRPGL